MSEIKFGVDESKISVVSGDEMMSLLQDLYEWMEDLDTEDGRDYIDGWIEFMPRIGRIIGK